MFINLSNHPSAKWSAKQLEAAKQFGEVKDLPFPNIDPNESTESVKQCAERVFAMCKGAKVVHVAGESTFVFAFVTIAKQNGLTCVASTTERKAVENADGTKTVAFEFVKFREY